MRFGLIIKICNILYNHNLNQRQSKLALHLSRFDFTLKHIPEVRMKKADELNRRLDWKIGIENDNKNQKLIKEEWI